MRALFVSYTSLLYCLQNGSVTQEQLDSGIFYFGCTRNHAMNPLGTETGSASFHDAFTPKPGAEPDMELARTTYRRIALAITRAEREGRIAFRKASERCSFRQLNALLAKNGCAELPTHHADVDDSGLYTQQGVEDRVRAMGLPLQVILSV